MRTEIEEANRLLAIHPLTCLRLMTWTGATATVCLEVVHVEHPRIRIGVIEFSGVGFLHFPESTSWGYRVRLAMFEVGKLPLPEIAASSGLVFEFFAEDSTEPSAYVVAETMKSRLD